MPKRILDVGQCGFDGPRLRELLQQSLGVEVDVARDAREALTKIGKHPYDLVLVNRIMASDGSSGLQLIETLAEEDDAPPVMLVSDLKDAQDEAVALGAVRGFGKAHMDDEQTLEAIQQAMA